MTSSPYPVCSYPATCQLHHQNTPPIIWVDRRWTLPSDAKIGRLVARAKAQDEEGDPITFGIMPDEFSDGSHLFTINNVTGVVYLTADLTGKENEQFYLRVTADDGHIPVVAVVWVVITEPTGNLSEFEQPPTSHTQPKLPPNLVDKAGAAAALPGRPRAPIALGVPSRPNRPSGAANERSSPTEPTRPQNATGAPLEKTPESGGPMDPTPIVVPIVLCVVLVLAVGCAIWFYRKWSSARKKTRKEENYAIEFQRRSGFGSETSDKMNDEQSSTWRRFDPKGIDATKLYLLAPST
ncbi:tyrosine kinase receptor Cad96Ca-like [Pollicipes pollicipes]|uniref:tyrosine kinase receptor Cad96Ca-like n=1 Tax=Pollicipes pollicipes TaxID=41117 RepID=UPI0018857A25|nr:tyrosine kinase receptor Cad96Ca-like [Pollicipes pollicipes]